MKDGFFVRPDTLTKSQQFSSSLHTVYGPWWCRRLLQILLVVMVINYDGYFKPVLSLLINIFPLTSTGLSPYEVKSLLIADRARLSRVIWEFFREGKVKDGIRENPTPPKDSKPHSLTTSQYHSLTAWQTQSLLASQPHTLTASQPHNLTSSKTLLFNKNQCRKSIWSILIDLLCRLLSIDVGNQ